jgi:hypothetical protein
LLRRRLQDVVTRFDHRSFWSSMYRVMVSAEI